MLRPQSTSGRYCFMCSLDYYVLCLKKRAGNSLLILIFPSYPYISFLSLYFLLIPIFLPYPYIAFLSQYFLLIPIFPSYPYISSLSLYFLLIPIFPSYPYISSFSLYFLLILIFPPYPYISFFFRCPAFALCCLQILRFRRSRHRHHFKLK